mgnify:CR=1 FL=1
MDILSDLFTRPVIAHTHLPGVLHFLSMKGKEGLSQLYSFEVELVAKTYMLDCRDALGKSLSLQIETKNSVPRFMHGVITKFELVGREMLNSKYYIYKATVSPLLWYATKNKEYKIFQNQTVLDIVQEVLGEYGLEIELKLGRGAYRTWEYCVQYDETDFDFISRLLEHEGLYYWFKMFKGKHTMVITDHNSLHEPYTGYGMFTYYDPNEQVSDDKEHVSDWHVISEIASGAYATDDYDFKKSRASIDSRDSLGTEATAGSNEVFEWLGGYVEQDDGDYYSMVRQEELRVERDIIHAVANIRAVKPGRIFKLRNHPRSKENKTYLCVSAEYDFQVAGYSTGTQRPDKFSIAFKALPINTQFRKKRETPKPKTYGPQTAKVVGPAGEEIWTDKYGRVKVQFHWDRYGQSDEDSSCWVRVSSPWAGSGFGALQIPRINQEVIVDFIGGNPDRPIIIGRVNNDANMPLVDLPAQAHTSGFRSKTVHGDTHQENHLLMIDEMGKELVDVRAQLDMVMNILRNMDVTVGNNLTTLVKGDEKRDVKRTRTTTVDGHEAETFNAGVTSRITAAGLDDDVQGGVLRNVDGGNIYTLQGDNSETITGNESYTLNGSGTYKTTGTRTTTVDGAVSDTFGSSWTQNVSGLVDQTYGATKNEQVTGAVTETFSSTYQRDVTGTTSITSNGDWTMTQKGNKIELTGGSEIKVTAPSKITLDAPTVEITDKSNWNKGAYKFDTYGFVGIARGLELKAIASATTLYIQKADVGGWKIDYKGIETKNSAMSMKTAISEIVLAAAVKLETSGFKGAAEALLVRL